MKYGAFDPAGKANRIWQWELKSKVKKGEALAEHETTWLSGYDAWVAAGKPKPPKPVPPPDAAEPLLDDPRPPPAPKVAPPPPPPLDTPPKVDPEVPRQASPKGKGAKGGGEQRWQERWRPDLAEMTGGKLVMVGPDGKEVQMGPRETMCVGCAALTVRLLAWAEEGLSKIDKKPVITSGQLFGPAVLFFDETLPDQANITPAKFFVAGAATIMAMRVYHYKAIAEAEKKGTALADRAKRDAEIRERTRVTEEAHAKAEAERAKAAAVEVKSETASQPAAVVEAPPPTPQPSPIPSKGPLVMDGPPQYREKPEDFDLTREWNLDPNTVI